MSSDSAARDVSHDDPEPPQMESLGAPSNGRVMKSRMAGVIAFFVLAGLWAATILTVQAMQVSHYR